jgi:putative colanic acid biosynthesis UDP-glucose lipid carrier transferase
MRDGTIDPPSRPGLGQGVRTLRTNSAAIVGAVALAIGTVGLWFGTTVPKLEAETVLLIGSVAAAALALVLRTTTLSSDVVIVRPSAVRPRFAPTVASVAFVALFAVAAAAAWAGPPSAVPAASLGLAAAAGGCLFVRARQASARKAVALVGAGDQARLLIRTFGRAGGAPLRWFAIGSDPQGAPEPGDPEDAPPGSFDELTRAVRDGTVAKVVLALPPAAENRTLEIVNRLGRLPVDVYLAPDCVSHLIMAAQPLWRDRVALLQVQQRPFGGARGVVKWMQDKIIGGVLLLLFAPLMMVIAVAVAVESPGPILFRQVRHGFNNRPITIFKFRTMVHRPTDRFRQATRDDPRITRVGRLLRRNSLDELPQLFNVLNGTMSLVGPRPHPIDLNDKFAELIPDLHARHKVKPGITGWAQINGLRGETDTLEKMRLRIEHDLYYVESCSLLFDLSILATTAFSGWNNRNAY